MQCQDGCIAIFILEAWTTSLEQNVRQRQHPLIQRNLRKTLINLEYVIEIFLKNPYNWPFDLIKLPSEFSNFLNIMLWDTALCGLHDVGLFLSLKKMMISWIFFLDYNQPASSSPQFCFSRSWLKFILKGILVTSFPFFLNLVIKLIFM